jgi:hypothetical protein
MPNETIDTSTPSPDKVPAAHLQLNPNKKQSSWLKIVVPAAIAIAVLVLLYFANRG